MNSGGDQKLQWERIFIEAPYDEAVRVFYAKFGRHPENVTCSCCGSDYSIDESESLELATAYARNCRYLSPSPTQSGRYFEEGEPIPAGWTEHSIPWGTYKTVEEFSVQDDIKIVYAKDISPEERAALLPELHDADDEEDEYYDDEEEYEEYGA